MVEHGRAALWRVYPPVIQLAHRFTCRSNWSTQLTVVLAVNWERDQVVATSWFPWFSWMIVELKSNHIRIKVKLESCLMSVMSSILFCTKNLLVVLRILVTMTSTGRQTSSAIQSGFLNLTTENDLKLLRRFTSDSDHQKVGGECTILQIAFASLFAWIEREMCLGMWRWIWWIQWVHRSIDSMVANQRLLQTASEQTRQRDEWQFRVV